MDQDFMGKGWKFPVRVDSKTGRIQMSQGEEDIHESILIILQTAKGERPVLPKFGGEIHQFVFGLTDTGTLTMIENAVKEAIDDWEPRVGRVSVNAAVDPEVPGKIVINVSYEVLATNNTHNLVYPFYISGERE
jgi:phage baseplate assembly protein W